jgi:hypothetical protein
MLWDYQEEPDVAPAEKPTQATPAPAPRGQKGIQRLGMTTTQIPSEVGPNTTRRSNNGIPTAAP